MKGLMIKDLRLLGNQKIFLILMLCVSVILLFTVEDSEYFVMGYLTFIGVIFAMGTISYDEFDNGNAFLFSLPFTRREYVLEKYLFCLLFGLALWAVSIVEVVLGFLGKGLPLDGMVFGITALIYVLIFIVILALLMPFQLKFGAERGQIARIVSFGLVFAVFSGLAALSDFVGLDLLGVLKGLSSMGAYAVFGLCFLGAAVLLALSCLVSLKIIGRKEF